MYGQSGVSSSPTATAMDFSRLSVVLIAIAAFVAVEGMLQVVFD